MKIDRLHGEEEAMTAWFDEFRRVYATWWEGLCERLDETEPFEWCQRDQLVPVADLGAYAAEYPRMPEQLRSFLAEVGVGRFFFPVPGEDEPDELHIFGLTEALARSESIRQHAERELEELNEWRCDVHDDAPDCACRRLLKNLSQRARWFYPLVGPDHVYDFVFVFVDGPDRGKIGHWYHDYPAVELLDGSYEFASLSAFGDEWLRLGRTGQGRLI